MAYWPYRHHTSKIDTFKNIGETLTWETEGHKYNKLCVNCTLNNTWKKSSFQVGKLIIVPFANILTINLKKQNS